ncbi:MFS transporter [Streptomyces sp. NPDC012438]|uniref:MFS transporter n=1 Tax=Streptomyces sp. NPDC012438 TaxID=3364833 RepID=UPI0036ED441B
MATPPPRTRDPGTITAVVALSGIVVSLTQTLVVPIIPKLPQMPGTSASSASWAITAPLLAAAVVTPIAGRPGDMFGKRCVLITSLAVLVAGSLVCAVSDSLAPMVVGRPVQGLATGVIPVGISVLRDELSADRVGGAVSPVSATLGVGGAIGPPSSAAIVQRADWHVLFWIAAGPGALCLLLVTLLLSECPNPSPGRFDALGAAGPAAGLVLLPPVAKGGDWGRTSPATLGLFTVGLSVTALWCRHETRAPAFGRPQGHRAPPGAPHQPGLRHGRLRDVRHVTDAAAAVAVTRGDRLRPGPVGPARTPTESGFRTTYLVAIGATVIGLLPTLAVPRARRAPHITSSDTSLPTNLPVTTGKH